MVFPMGSMAFPIACIIDHDNRGPSCFLCFRGYLLLVYILFPMGSSFVRFNLVLWLLRYIRCVVLCGFHGISYRAHVMSYGPHAIYCVQSRFYGLTGSIIFSMVFLMGPPYQKLSTIIHLMAYLPGTWFLRSFVRTICIKYSYLYGISFGPPKVVSSSFYGILTPPRRGMDTEACGRDSYRYKEGENPTEGKHIIPKTLSNCLQVCSPPITGYYDFRYLNVVLCRYHYRIKLKCIYHIMII